jgi:ankyrin repeat protein
LSRQTYTKQVSAICDIVQRRSQALLLSAAQRGDLNRVRQLLETEGINVDTIKNRYGWNALHIASHHGRTAVVQFLVSEAGAYVNAVDNDGWTALHLATVQGQLEIVEILDVDTGNVDGNTALHLASSANNLEIVQSLLNVASADVEVADSSVGHFHVTEYLVEQARANVEAADNNGLTALHLVSKHVTSRLCSTWCNGR